MKKNLLDYSFPSDLKDMSINEMELLAVQIREFLLDNISVTGGHLASNLGVVELSIALHHFLNTPVDKLVWDVGHQTYVHKILTGRASQFSTLRKTDGLSGFPKRCESDFDTFDTGHSSNSISVAAGFASARDLQKENYRVVAVIGDGALTGGMSYEGLNNIGALNSKSIIIINDNGMSIGANTGGLSKHLSKIRLSRGYAGFKKGLSKILKEIPKVGDAAYDTAVTLRDKIKYSLVDGVLFEQLGFKYIGVIDGHSIKDILEALKMAESSTKSVILHIETKKGKGYLNAEKNAAKFHGVGPFDKISGEAISSSSEKTFSAAFGDAMIEAASKNDKVVAISAAMVSGTGLSKFAELYPNRIFDVGIAEAHGATFAGSLGISGMKPVLAVYSTFLQRAYDQIITDICLQNSNCILALDRAGHVGADGETHHGLFDISYLKNIPNLRFYAPSTCKDLEEILLHSISTDGPVAIRYPRGTGSTVKLASPIASDGSVKDEIVYKGSKVAIIALGNMISEGLIAYESLKEKGITASLVAARSISPIDKETLEELSDSHEYFITLEDGIISGGYGEKLGSYLVSKEGEKVFSSVKLLNIGWKNNFVSQGDTKTLMEREGMTGEVVAERIIKFIER